jgi:hypothetical protein
VTTLAARLDTARRNVVQLARSGSTKRDYLAGSAGTIEPGKRGIWLASAKTGKSISAEVLAVDIVEAGATVVILDRENGADEYARRLTDIIRARGDHAATWHAVSERLHYFEYPTVLLADGAELATALECDLVIFDSSRMFLTCNGLVEDSSDDYSKFITGLIDPLAHAGIATLNLDNTGNTAKDRPRGTSAKEDLHDAVFTLKAITTPSPTKRGRLLLTCKLSRFGQAGSAWQLELGGGTFGSWEPVGGGHDAVTKTPPAAQVSTAQMERISRAIEAEPGLSTREVRSSITGRDTDIALAVESLVAGGYVEVRQEGRANRHYTEKAYRADSEPTLRAQRVPPWPDRGPDTCEVTVAACPSLRGHEHGPRSEATQVDGDRGPEIDDELIDRVTAIAARNGDLAGMAE